MTIIWNGDVSKTLWIKSTVRKVSKERRAGGRGAQGHIKRSRSQEDLGFSIVTLEARTYGPLLSIFCVKSIFNLEFYVWSNSQARTFSDKPGLKYLPPHERC